MSNLPVRLTRLIGREHEIAHVRQLLVEHRWVTVTAVGGSGKTRLAIAVGEAELAHRRDGVWFVDLTAGHGRQRGARRRREGGWADACVAAIRSSRSSTSCATKRRWCILDNCEHVIEASASFVARFLAVPGPAVVLATSREALAIDGEQTVVLGSLRSDGADAPAVRLFADRAAAVDLGFAVDEANADVVATLCTHLDGMPLAIELAAARVTVMTPSELLEGLSDRFALLSGGRRRQRRRTLEATLDWSYDLLDADEQRVMRALGVFVDGFDIDAVSAVAGLSRQAAMIAVEALVTKSLVVRVPGGDRARFSLLETVKAYAEDRLVRRRRGRLGTRSSPAPLSTALATRARLQRVLRAAPGHSAATRSEQSHGGVRTGSRGQAMGRGGGTHRRQLRGVPARRRRIGGRRPDRAGHSGVRSQTTPTHRRLTSCARPLSRLVERMDARSGASPSGSWVPRSRRYEPSVSSLGTSDRILRRRSGSRAARSRGSGGRRGAERRARA